MSAEEVQVSYDPGTNSSTVDDRWRAPDGDLLGAVGHPVRFDVAGDLVDLEQRGR